MTVEITKPEYKPILNCMVLFFIIILMNNVDLIILENEVSFVVDAFFFHANADLYCFGRFFC